MDYVSSSNLWSDAVLVEFLVELVTDLREPNVPLFHRVVTTVDHGLCRELLDQTKSIEDTGGMVAEELSRKKTAGGIFLRLLKSRISSEQVRYIWDEQNRQRREYVKVRKRQRAKTSDGLAARSIKAPGIAWPHTSRAFNVHSNNKSELIIVENHHTHTATDFSSTTTTPLQAECSSPFFQQSRPQHATTIRAEKIRNAGGRKGLATGWKGKTHRNFSIATTGNHDDCCCRRRRRPLPTTTSYYTTTSEEAILEQSTTTTTRYNTNSKRRKRRKRKGKSTTKIGSSPTSGRITYTLHSLPVDSSNGTTQRAISMVVDDEEEEGEIR